MVDLNSLVIFAKVVESNSFSEAARRLKMPISTVSRRIAELEDQLGVRLLERSTHSLRLTDIGAEILEHAQNSAGLTAAVENIVSNQLAVVSGALRLSAPPSVSETLIGPLVSAFQAFHPNVRAHVLVTGRHINHIADGVDLAFRLGECKDSSLVALKILTYRHWLVASPEYLNDRKAPDKPQDLLDHRLIAFSNGMSEANWRFEHVNGKYAETLVFEPYVSMNDFAGLIPLLLEGGGIGDLPPVVAPGLLRDRRLVEVMPNWRFPTLSLSLVHLGNRNMTRPLRLFKEFAAQRAPIMFPDLPV